MTQELTAFQQAVLTLVNKQQLLAEMVEQEPLLLPLLELATLQPGRAHWRAYSALKQIGAVLVGWDARNPALASAGHYETFCQAIDALLPEEGNSPVDRLITDLAEQMDMSNERTD